MVKLTVAIPTKLYINAVTILSLFQSFPLSGYIIEVKILPGKSNIDQARSILVTNWYDSASEEDLFLFLDADQTFTSQDILSLINLNCDVACGVYSSLDGRPTCRPKDYPRFMTGENKEIYYGATGLMLVRKPILCRVEALIKKEYMGHSRFWISNDNNAIIPFFIQRLIISETIPSDTPVPEWLGEDYGFCWAVRRVGGTIKCHVSPTIGHQVAQIKYFYPESCAGPLGTFSSTQDAPARFATQTLAGLEYQGKQWNRKSIVYYTGESRLLWSPEYINKEGLGGSETAVIYLGRYWQAKGYEVTVYGNVIEGIYDGVTYVTSKKFQSHDRFNILILWRSYSFSVLNQVKAKQILVDLHDMPNPHYKPLLDHLNKVDHVMVKSQFHRSLFSPTDKFVCIPNGLPPDYWNLPISPPRNRHRLIYASSYDRGLVEMLQWGFPLIKDAVPEAELHIYYGMELLPIPVKDKLLPLLQQKGVFEHGRISQQELLRKKQESAIHYYIGCASEIDCISVKESVMAGCFPVVSNVNVFMEKNYCLKIDGHPNEQDTHIKASKVIIRLLQDETFYQQAYEKVRAHCNEIENWETIANRWSEVFPR